MVFLLFRRIVISLLLKSAVFYTYSPFQNDGSKEVPRRPNDTQPYVGWSHSLLKFSFL